MSEIYFTHRDYQEAVVKLLTHYGFIAQLEYWFSIDGEIYRLDVYGHCARKEMCDEIKVVAEVSRTSLLENDLNKVYEFTKKSRSAYGFILAIKIKEIPPVSWQRVFVVRNLNELEDKLRELLKVPEDYPRITPRIIGEITPPVYRDLDEAFDKFNIPVDLRERARRLLLHAYATSRYKSCYKLYVDEYPYPIQFLIPGEQPRRRTVGDEAAFNILYQLGIVDLIRDSKAGAYVVKVKDERIAKIEAEKFIERIEENLKKLIRKYGWEVAFITYGRGEKWRGEDINVPLFKVLWQNQLLYEQPSIYFEHKELLNRIEIAVGALRPVIKEKYQEFWNELEKLGLAFSCENGLILLPEAQRIMIKFIEDKVVKFAKNDKLIRDLALLNVLYHYFPLEPLDERTLKGLFEILNTLGLKLEDLEKASQELYDQGLTSRFIKDQPPYMIIYNTNKFREAIIAKIKLLYNQLST